MGGIGGVGGVGGDGPDANCAWNGPGGCGGDKDREGKKQSTRMKNGNSLERNGKSVEEKKQRPQVVGSERWTVQEWLKHG